MKKKWLPRITGVMALVVFIVLGLGCATAPTLPTPPEIDLVAAPATFVNLTRVPWSNHTLIPDKNYVVVGAVVVRNVNPQTVYADLIERAIEMGGHDIINVRMGREVAYIPAPPIVIEDRTVRVAGTIEVISVTATAVVIRFTDETIEVDPMIAFADTLAVGAEANRVPWAHHTRIPNKEYVVVGTIVVRDTNLWEVHADLIERAIEMGGHDIINFRIAPWQDNQLITATAVAIRYTDETIVVGQTMTAATGYAGGY